MCRNKQSMKKSVRIPVTSGAFVLKANEDLHSYEVASSLTRSSAKIKASVRVQR